MAAIQPPPRPWKKGTQEGYSALSIEVEVCQDTNGCVFSAHQPQSEEDRVTALSWNSGGQEQVAFALLVEATRREAFLEMLIQMSQDEGYPKRLLELSAEEREPLLREMTQRITAQMNSVVSRLARGIIEETARVFVQG